MKLYFAIGTYFEKQADARVEVRGTGQKFKTVEFPFAASPKAEFVAWLNVVTRPPAAPAAAYPQVFGYGGAAGQ
jgi:hypothetical protein